MSLYEALAEFECNEPATDAEIAAVEARLGVKLPADYVAFLRRANGAARYMRTGEGEEEGGFIDLSDTTHIDYDEEAEAVAIGYDGGSYWFAIDVRTDPPTYRALPIENPDEEPVLTLGTTFEQMVERGRAGLLGPQPQSC